MRPTLRPSLPIDSGALRTPPAVTPSAPMRSPGGPARQRPTPQATRAPAALEDLTALTGVQRTALHRIEIAVDDVHGVLTGAQVRRALAHAVATMPRRTLTRAQLNAALYRELIREHSPFTARREAQGILRAIEDQDLRELSPVAPAPPRKLPRLPATPPPTPTTAPPGGTPRAKWPQITTVPTQTLALADHDLRFDSAAIEHTLRTTDFAHDFKTVLQALRVVFQQLHQAGQPHVTRVFLGAVDNKFAIVSPRESLQESRRRYPITQVTLDGVQLLPATRGFVILDGGNRLSAWHVTTETAEVASMDVNALRSYLTKHRMPEMSYDVVSTYQRSTGSAMRDLASIAAYLRERESGLRPLLVDERGRTQREWSPQHLDRMGEKAPHRVREHLRALPTSGEKTIVREHGRFLLGGWPTTTVRMYLL